MQSLDRIPATAGPPAGSDALDPRRSDAELIVYTLSTLIRIWRMTMGGPFPDVTPDDRRAALGRPR